MSRKAFLLLILLILSACGENVQVNQTTDTGFEDEKSWEISYLESIQARVIYFDKLITEVEKNYIKYKNNEITRYEFKVSLNLYYSDLKYPLGSIILISKFKLFAKSTKYCEICTAPTIITFIGFI